MVQHRPLVHSLHAPDGKVVAVFACSNIGETARQVGEWIPHFQQGYICIVWRHGYPHSSMGERNL